MNNILTSSTEPYDLSLSRSFQNLSHLPPSYELALKSDSCKSPYCPLVAVVTHPQLQGCLYFQRSSRVLISRR